MDAYLNRGIKDIIDEFPEVERVLNDYDIGCGPCTVGICLLKDIVEIHRLSEDQQQELMTRIDKAMHPEKRIKISPAEKRTVKKPKGFKYSPPIKKLVDEHVLIKRWIALIPEVVENLDVGTEEGRQLILNGIDMIKSFADKFHHAKEEEILFQYFDEKTDILKIMHEDHTRARGIVEALLDALERNDQRTISEKLMAYRDLLTEHIRKEDEILYPWMDNQLSTRQIGELFARFIEADRKLGIAPEKYEHFVDQLEKKYFIRQA